MVWVCFIAVCQELLAKVAGNGRVEQLEDRVRRLHWEKEKEKTERELDSLLAAVSRSLHSSGLFSQVQGLGREADSMVVLAKRRDEVTAMFQSLDQRMDRMEEASRLVQNSGMAGLRIKREEVMEARAMAEARAEQLLLYWSKVGTAREEVGATNRRLLAWSQVRRLERKISWPAGGHRGEPDQGEGDQGEGGAPGAQVGCGAGEL